MSMTQKEAVYQSVRQVKDFEDFAEPVELTKEERDQVCELTLELFEAGKANLTHEPVGGLKKYMPGLVNNWLRKDKRLNGDTTYKIKNPGSRAGSGNPEIKELKRLIKQVPEENRAEIQEMIDAKVAELKASKQEKINIDLIPERFKHLVK